MGHAVARLLVEVVDVKTKQLTEYLTLAGVPDGLHAQVIDCMSDAHKRSAGLTWASLVMKWY